MKIIPFLFLLTVLFIPDFKGNAQQSKNIIENNILKFEKLKRDDGLFHNSITTIHQDSKGYMWFGTFNGLYKYDGYHFQLYKKNVDDKNSLIDNNILTITEDKDGKIWIGTRNGLCWYNRDLDRFLSKIPIHDSIESKVITKSVFSIYQDSYNVLWIGTDHGLYQLLETNGKYNFSLHKTNTSKNGLSHNKVNAIVEDEHNNIWVGTNNGLNKIALNRQGHLLFKHYFHDKSNNQSISNNHITSLLLDDFNNIWIGTKKGLNKLGLQKGNNAANFINYYSDDFDEKSLPNNNISALAKDENGNVWIGTRHKGISLYSKNEFTNYKNNQQDDTSISSNEVSSIYADKYGVLWVGVIAGGLNKLDLRKKNIAHFKYNAADSQSLSGNIVNHIFEDSSKSIWIATHNSGLNKLINKDGNVYFTKYGYNENSRNSLSSNTIFSVCEDNYGNIWVGTETKGLNKIGTLKNTKGTSQINQYSKDNSSLSSNNISVMLKDQKGDIWMGSFDGDGLMRFTPKNNTIELPKVFHYKRDPAKINTLSSDNISYLYEDSQLNLWIGTYGGGLIKVTRDINNNPVDYLVIKNEIGNKNSLSNDNVFSIIEDKNDNIWIATFGGGLNKISNTERKNIKPKVKRFNNLQGLTNDELYGLIEDEDNNLWISSNQGIFKFDIAHEVFTNYTVNNGFQALNFRKFAFCKSSDSYMYFGGINGFNVFNPKQLVPNKRIPDIEIVDFKIFNESVKVEDTIAGKVILKKSISETKEVVLEKALNAFSFEFSGLHYSAPTQNSYEYFLEGFDKTWNKTNSNRRYAAYSNLDAGTYIFKVKASNSDGMWNNTSKELKITILPSWWNTWWAYILYFLVAMLLMLVFRHFTVINHEYQNKLKIERIEQENIKKMNAAKLEFFTNISHEFKTPLTLILGPLQHLITADYLDLKVKNTLLSVERNANNLYKLINQVLEFRKIETNEVKVTTSKEDIVSYINEVINSFYFLIENKKIRLTFNTNISKFVTQFDKDKIEKIMNNLISNCIKYTEEKGEINVSLKFCNPSNTSKNINLLEIIVEDNGVGIPKNQIALIFNRFYKIDKLNRSNSMGSGIGLALTKSLVELLNGTITVESKEHKGSVFTITLPLNEVDTRNIKPPISTEFITKLNPEIVNEESERPSNTFTGESVSLPKSALPLLLIIEDNTELQQFVKETLEDDYNIIQAFDGKQGLNVALKEVPDIIISDIMLPYNDGIEICDTLKKNDITNHIPIILLTARASIEHRIEGLEVGADAYIAKPFHIKHLKVSLTKLLKQRQILKDKFAIAGNDSNQKNNKNFNKYETEFLERIKNIISHNIQNSQFGVTELGEALNFSRMQLYRKLKSITDMSANEFIRDFRIKKAAQMMLETDLNISEIAYDVGFNNLSYFTKCFKAVYGLSPSHYIKQENKG